MGEHDIVVVVPFSRKGEIPLEYDLEVVGGEYETFWTENGRVYWKMYSPNGVVVVQMKIDILMECLLGDPTIMARLFNVATKE